MKKIILKDINYTIEDIYNYSINSYNLSLSKVLVEKINKSRELVDIKSKSDNPIYGINTGFGKLSQIKILDQKYFMPLFSVIIPVFNAEKYLKKCIRSVLSQKNDRTEIILVDDCSTDNSLKICNYFKKFFYFFKF